MAYKKDNYLTLQQNVANLGFQQNVIARKIPHGNFEKLACMV
jgi:hypothetical protein